MTEIERLRADEQSLVVQMHQIQGAIYYIRQTIARVEKEAKEEKRAPQHPVCSRAVHRASFVSLPER